MNIEGLVVKHKILGVGTVTKFDGTFLTVAFESKISMFQYPSAFTGFIEAADSADQAAILKSIEDEKAAAIAKQQEIEAAKRAEAERNAEETAVHWVWRYLRLLIQAGENRWPPRHHPGLPHKGP